MTSDGLAIDADELERLQQHAGAASHLLKALSNRDRLLILCYLAGRERNVGELEELLGLRQPTLSQQLSRLRSDGLVATRRAGKSIYYSLASCEARTLIDLLYRLYCADGDWAGSASGANRVGECVPAKPAGG